MKFIICGNYGAGNLGDELILEGLLKEFSEKFTQSEFTVMSANPEETSKKYKVCSVPHIPSGAKSSLKSIFQRTETKKELKDADCFILGGGGLFLSLRKRANWIWGVQAMKALWYRKPLIIWGQSLET